MTRKPVQDYVDIARETKKIGYQSATIVSFIASLTVIIFLVTGLPMIYFLLWLFITTTYYAFKWKTA